MYSIRVTLLVLAVTLAAPVSVRALQGKKPPRPAPGMVVSARGDQPGALHVLALGVDDYGETLRLRWCRADAMALADRLKESGKELFSRVRARVLVDREVSRSSVTAALEEIASEARPEDTFVFAFSGREYRAVREGSAGEELFLLPPVDLKNGVLPTQDAESIPFRLLQTWSARIPARSQLFLLDSCESDSAFAAFVRDIAGRTEEARELLGRNIAILGAKGTAFELGDPKEGKPGGHGAMTFALLEGLSGKAYTGANPAGITLREILAYVNHRVPEITEGIGIPSSYFVGRDFLLAAAPAETSGAEVRARAGRRDRALLFATDAYDDWNPLVNPIADAEAIAKELSTVYGFETRIVRNPTQVEILRTLREYARLSYGPEDQLFLFFAGHGTFDSVYKEGYLVAKDSRRDDDTKLGYISHSNLRTMVDGIPCGHILLALDVCHSGTFDRRIAMASSRGDPYERASAREMLARKKELVTRLCITSGGNEYVSDGVPGRHSPFARALLEALRSRGGRNRALTFHETLAFLQDVKPEPRWCEFGANDPGSDFLFLAR